MASNPPTITELTSQDNPVYYQSTNDRWVKSSLTVLLEWIQSNYAATDPTAQRIVPVTGQEVQVTGGGTSIWLQLRPATALATLTVKLPAVANATDGQEVWVTSTTQITALTVDKNGATAVNGAPASLGADNAFKLRYDSTTDEWQKVA